MTRMPMGGNQIGQRAVQIRLRGPRKLHHDVSGRYTIHLFFLLLNLAKIMFREYIPKFIQRKWFTCLTPLLNSYVLEEQSPF